MVSDEERCLVVLGLELPHGRSLDAGAPDDGVVPKYDGWTYAIDQLRFLKQKPPDEAKLAAAYAKAAPASRYSTPSRVTVSTKRIFTMPDGWISYLPRSVLLSSRARLSFRSQHDQASYIPSASWW